MAIYAKHTACTTIASAAAAPQLPPWLVGHLPCRLLVCLIFTTKTESVPTKFHQWKEKNKTKVLPIGQFSFPELELIILAGQSLSMEPQK
jgi:hypothetical protein